MTLPRSVKFMAEDSDFKPKQCQSDAFKGFSFIQSDFDLPDRTDEQHDHYWNNFEADGESASDNASSMGDDYDWMQCPAPHRPTLESTPEVSEKKKRPPRKKKTKPQMTSSDTNTTNDTPTPTIKSELSTIISDTHSSTKSEVEHVTPFATTDHAAQMKLPSMLPLPEASSTSINCVEKIKMVTKLNAPKPQPTVSVWETVSKSNSKTLNTPQKSISTALKADAPTFKPGSKLNGMTTSIHPQKPLPMSDWRSHKISTTTNKIPPLLSNANDFPALGNFPLTPNTARSNFKEDFPALSDFPSLSQSGSTNASKRQVHTSSSAKPIDRSVWGVKR